MLKEMFDTLNEAFDKNIICEVEKNKILLKELEKDANGQKRCTQKCTIKGIPEESIVLKLDKYENEEKFFFSGNKEENKRCDYLIITKSKHKYYILFIELKQSLKNKGSRCRKQFKASKSLFVYFKSVLENFYDISFGNQFKERKIVILSSDYGKRKTQSQINKNGIIRISNNKISFSRLIA